MDIRLNDQGVTAKEAVAELKTIKLNWRNRLYTTAAAEAKGKQYVDIYNAHARLVAKTLKVKPRLMGYKVTDYPNEGLW